MNEITKLWLGVTVAILMSFVNAVIQQRFDEALEKRVTALESRK